MAQNRQLITDNRHLFYNDSTNTFTGFTVSLPDASTALITSVAYPSRSIVIVFLNEPSASTSAGSAFTVTIAPGSVFPNIRNRLPICWGGDTVNRGGRARPDMRGGSVNILNRRTRLQSEG